MAVLALYATQPPRHAARRRPHRLKHERTKQVTRTIESHATVRAHLSQSHPPVICTLRPAAHTG